MGGLTAMNRERAGAGAPPHAPWEWNASEWPSGSLTDERVVEEWRREFPLLERVIHVGICSQGPQSRWVRQSVEHYLDSWVAVGMDWDYWLGEVGRAKAEFAKLVGAEPDEVAVSTSLSAAAASVASALEAFGSRRKIVTTTAEFTGVAQAWLGHRKYGYTVEHVPARAGELHLEDFDRHIDDKTILTAVSHVYHSSGFKLDLAPLVKLAHERGSLVMVDAYQSAGTMPIDVKALGVDFLASGTLKFLLGMPGMAFIYVARELIPRLDPAVVGWFGQEDPFECFVDRLDYARGARRLETGTPPVMAAFAARAGMQIINHVGPAAIAKRIELLSRVATEEARRHGLKVASPADVRKKGSITAIEVPEGGVHGLVTELRRRGIITFPCGRYLRVAPHFFTRPEDIERVMWEVASILGGR